LDLSDIGRDQRKSRRPADVLAQRGLQCGFDVLQGDIRRDLGRRFYKIRQCALEGGSRHVIAGGSRKNRRQLGAERQELLADIPCPPTLRPIYSRRRRTEKRHDLSVPQIIGDQLVRRFSHGDGVTSNQPIVIRPVSALMRPQAAQGRTVNLCISNVSDKFCVPHAYPGLTLTTSQSRPDATQLGCRESRTRLRQ
jgi:hypothetical protein